MEFIDFKDAKPEHGMVTWKGVADGIPVLFNAEMRWRGAGFKNVLSPQFDYWDGYSVHVRHDVQWTPSLQDLNERNKEIRPLVGIASCPFCKRKPKVHYSGLVGEPPMNADYFYMTCCRFTAGFSNRVKKLDNLISGWNAALDQADATETMAQVG